MSIKEIAQQYGMSVQAVYKKIKLAGIDLNTLKDSKTGRLTGDGERVIISLVESKKPLETQETGLKQEVERLNAVNQQLKEKVEMLEQSVEALRSALKASQMLQLETLKRIPAALPAGEKKGLFSFLHRRKAGSDQ